MSDEADISKGDSSSDWEQFFPTYRFGDRDIALSEYESASRLLESEERLFIQASNIFFLIGAAIASIFINYLSNTTTANSNRINSVEIWSLSIAIVILFSFVSIAYFVERQKSVVYAARKVIVLRRMLGLDFGSLRIVLPNWRIEGANEPFAIKVFPGWFKRVSLPFWLIAFISTSIVYILVAQLRSQGLPDTFNIFLLPHDSLIDELFALKVAIAWGLLLCTCYRLSLLDYHETGFLLFAKFAAGFLRLRVVKNFEYVLYRAKLATFEASRVGIDLSDFEETLVFLEDRKFFSHRGISPRSMARAIAQYYRTRKRSGGSTITQQLARTLFIEFPSPPIRRKFVEILFAIWLERVLTKVEILNYYLASVRFERGVYGLPAAIEYFGLTKHSFSSGAVSFFLIERVSNIRSRFLGDKVAVNLKNAVETRLLELREANQVLDIYRNAIRKGQISEDFSKKSLEEVQSELNAMLVTNLPSG